MTQEDVWALIEAGERRMKANLEASMQRKNPDETAYKQAGIPVPPLVEREGTGED